MEGISELFVASGTFCIALILSLSVYGYLNARHIHTTDYSVTIDKTCKNLDSMRVVLVADLHLATAWEMRRCPRWSKRSMPRSRIWW